MKVMRQLDGTEGYHTTGPTSTSTSYGQFTEERNSDLGHVERSYDVGRHASGNHREICGHNDGKKMASICFA